MILIEIILLGTVTNDWQDTEYVLNIFGTSLRAARRAYMEILFPRELQRAGDRIWWEVVYSGLLAVGLN